MGERPKAKALGYLEATATVKKQQQQQQQQRQRQNTGILRFAQNDDYYKCNDNDNDNDNCNGNGNSNGNSNSNGNGNDSRGCWEEGYIPTHRDETAMDGAPGLFWADLEEEETTASARDC
jgi:hypothetical protein